MVSVNYIQKLSWPRYYRHYLVIGTSAIILIAAFVTFLPFFLRHTNAKPGDRILESLLSPSQIVLKSSYPTYANKKCSYYSCFNIYKCGKLGFDHILIYVYPHNKYIDSNGIPISNLVSKEFYVVIKTIVESKYYTSSPEHACIFVPSLDVLNQNRLRLIPTSQVLASLPFWNGGMNHLLFNMIPGSTPEFNTTLDVSRGSAMLAAAGFSTATYRTGFDISIPLFNPIHSNFTLEKLIPKKWLLISMQYNLDKRYVSQLKKLYVDHKSDFLLLKSCLDTSKSKIDYRCSLQEEAYKYPSVLQQGVFCFIGQGSRFAQTALIDAMMTGCIPVVVADGFVMPFSEVLDWKRASLRFFESEIPELRNLLKSVSDKQISSMKAQLKFFYESYFQTISKITLTTLQILNDRVFPHSSWLYADWNDLPAEHDVNKLSLPLIASPYEGFTAVILTYDRLQSLYQVIKQISKVPSLSKILVVWNNQKRAPPPASNWPKIIKPLKVIRTSENKLSNRFYPYQEIETQAILSIDDDIVMMTSDEIEFAYQVWREFPDRIVGFPSRVHLWDNNTQKWKYESEWMNDISMVLTGIAFYHKYYHYAYMAKMPANIKNWVDEIMNCEDIAMNFLVSNITGKAPIKVAPRKKFKCSECNSAGMSADVTHMVERSECINRFTKEYGYMPLKTIEFRADPVLFKDNLPEKLKAFNHIGKL